MEQAFADLANRFVNLESTLLAERARAQRLEQQAIAEKTRIEQLEARLSSLPSATSGTTTDTTNLIDAKTFGRPKAFNGDRIGWREFYAAFSFSVANLSAPMAKSMTWAEESETAVSNAPC